MRRVIAVATSLALVSAVWAAGVASATHSGGEGPKQDLVAGTGTLIVPQPFAQAPQLHVNAQRDPESGTPRGRFYIRYPVAPTNPFDLRGSITCLAVAGSNATAIGLIERVSGDPAFGAARGFVVGNFVQIRITDNGEPGALDQANFEPGTPNAPTSCVALAGDLPISQGNYIVHEHPPQELLAVLDVLLDQFEAAVGYPFDD